MTKLYIMAVKDPKILDMYILGSDNDDWWYNTNSPKVLKVKEGREAEGDPDGTWVVGI